MLMEFIEEISDVYFIKKYLITIMLLLDLVTELSKFGIAISKTNK
jgi:hypothetical protein